MASTAAPSAAPSSALTAITEAVRLRAVSTQNHDPSQSGFGILSSGQEESCASMHGLTGRSPAIRRLIRQMQRMAPHLNLATIEGEEGTGRSMAACALHASGPAAAGPFVPRVATEFFATSDGELPESAKGGRWSEEVVRQAKGGMLFLDRVHQLSAYQQEGLAAFLYWFDDRHHRTRQQSRTAAGAPVDSDPENDLPAQIVFSTSVPLRGSERGFRADLASRLCSVRFYLPPLTHRREDIPLLAQIFIQRFAYGCGKPVRGLGPGTISPLLRYSWPGNVRELEQTINAAALETESQWIRPIDLPPLASSVRQNSAEPGHEAAIDSELNLDRVVRNHVSRVLGRTRGNKLRAAQLLGISRSTLYRILATPPASTALAADPEPLSEDLPQPLAAT